MKIYCDNGACPLELKNFQKEGVVELFMFRYENNNRHIRNSGEPSKATWADMKNYAWQNAPGTWNDYAGSEKYDQIAELIGLANNRVDVLHVDSAYKNRCEIFITNDKDDIWSKREQLEPLLGMRFFHISEIEACVEYIKNANREHDNKEIDYLQTASNKYVPLFLQSLSEGVKTMSEPPNCSELFMYFLASPLAASDKILQGISNTIVWNHPEEFFAESVLDLVFSASVKPDKLVVRRATQAGMDYSVIFEKLSIASRLPVNFDDSSCIEGDRDVAGGGEIREDCFLQIGTYDLRG